MADTYEKDLGQKSSLTTSDYIRVVGSDNVSYKQLVSDVAKKIIENYTGSSLAGSSQSIKSALDSLNSKIGSVSVVSSEYLAGNTQGTTKTYQLASTHCYLLVCPKVNGAGNDSYFVSAHTASGFITKITDGGNVTVSIDKLELSVTTLVNYIRVILIKLS